MYGKSFTGGSFGRSVGRSISASNLRQQFSTDGESVLSPGAFAPGSSRYSSGSIRRLTIDRNIKPPELFSRQSPPTMPTPTTTNEAPAANGASASGEQPQKLKKRVSFDKGTTGGDANGHAHGETGALVRTEVDEEESTSEDQNFPRSSRRNKASNGTSSAPDSEQVRGKELAVVPEDRESDETVPKSGLSTDVHATPDPSPGDYWMRPTRAELRKTPRDKLQHFQGYQVGRLGCGHVTFDSAVDLTTVNLDDVFEKLVEIRLRSITVYPESVSKPPMGKGLNVPSTIQLENSWPRSRSGPSSVTSGPLFDKHVRRLKSMKGTEFLNYDRVTGIWIFRVPHYTRYGLDYDEDEDEEDQDDLEDSALSSLPETPVDPSQVAPSSASAMDVDDSTPGDSDQDDTFAFKQNFVPGGFGRQSVVDYEPDQSFLADGSAAAASGSEQSELDQEASDDEMNMAGSFPQIDGTVEQIANSPTKPILKATQQPWGTPGKPLIDLDGDWAEQLQRTISPRKQNREALREVQGKVLLDRAREPAKRPQSNQKHEFRTSIDVMNSLFGKHEERMALSRLQESAGSGSGFEV